MGEMTYYPTEEPNVRVDFFTKTDELLGEEHSRAPRLISNVDNHFKGQIAAAAQEMDHYLRAEWPTWVNGNSKVEEENFVERLAQNTPTAVGGIDLNWWDSDAARYDRSINYALKAVMLSLFEAVFPELMMLFRQDRAAKGKFNKNSKFDEFRLVLWILGTTFSGDVLTTIFNTLLMQMLTYYNIFLMEGSLVASRDTAAVCPSIPGFVVAKGDDMFTASITDHDVIRSMMSKFGLVLETKNGSRDIVKFCSGHFMRTATGYKFVRKIGRILTTAAWTAVPNEINEISAAGLYLAKSLCLAYETKGVPVAESFARAQVRLAKRQLVGLTCTYKAAGAKAWARIPYGEKKKMVEKAKHVGISDLEGLFSDVVADKTEIPTENIDGSLRSVFETVYNLGEEEQKATERLFDTWRRGDLDLPEGSTIQRIFQIR